MNLEIFCDESFSDILTSKKSPFSFMVIGGIWISAGKKNIFKQEIEAIRTKHKFFGEIKWNKILASRQGFYLALIDYFFKQEDMRFRCIAIDKSKVDLINYHQADAELSFYKFYYQLLHKWIDDFNSYSIFVDIKTTRVGNRLQTLKNCLNNSNISSEIKQIQALPSHEVIFIQLTDLLVGSVGSKFNNCSTSAVKKLIIQRIESHLTHEISPTPPDDVKFNVFKIVPGLTW